MAFRTMQRFLGLFFLGQLCIGPRRASCSVIGDLVRNYAANGARCLVVVVEKEIDEEIWTEINNCTVPLTIFESSVNSSYMKRGQSHMKRLHPGRDCSSYLFLLENVHSTLLFLNRQEDFFSP